jgi:NhaA family Na+:H+ antiporter
MATLPTAAAVGGMVVPAALIDFAINPAGEGAAGWGIPMATDIAFAIGALALLASRVPKTLITFLVALIIVDDLGAVRVIALFYTDAIAMVPLGVAGVLGALSITAQPKYHPKRFCEHVREVMERFRDSHDKDANTMTNENTRAVVTDA